MSSSRWRATEIPTPEAFFLEVPPYTRFNIGSWNFKTVLRIEFFQGTLDAYCVECGKEGVFNSNASLPYAGEAMFTVPATLDDFVEKCSTVWVPTGEEDRREYRSIELKDYAARDRFFSIQFECTREATHVLRFFFRVQDSKIMKIGQSPSLADLQSQEVKNYREVLGDSKYRELNRAIGLSAHGVGIGAFVYLRRIFEDLIDDAHAEAAKNEDWDEETFERSRWDEKILMLKDVLPSFLVEKRVIYSILSKGIHELTEEECLKYFGSLRLGIELILDEKIEQKERAEKIARTRKELDSITSELQ